LLQGRCEIADLDTFTQVSFQELLDPTKTLVLGGMYTLMSDKTAIGPAVMSNENSVTDRHSAIEIRPVAWAACIKTGWTGMGTRETFNNRIFSGLTTPINFASDRPCADSGVPSLK
jgi:hypothetical protein